MGRGRVRTGPWDASGLPLELAEASLDGASGPLTLQRSPAPAIGGQYTACAQGGCLATLLSEPSARATHDHHRLPRSVRRAYPRLLQQGSLH